MAIRPTTFDSCGGASECCRARHRREARLKSRFTSHDALEAASAAALDEQHGGGSVGVPLAVAVSQFATRSDGRVSEADSEVVALERLQRLQRYRQRNSRKFIRPHTALEKQTASDAAAEAEMAQARGAFLPAEPTEPYVLSSYVLGEDHALERLDQSDTGRYQADIPPKVHQLPRATSYVRVSVPKSLARPLDVDDPKSNAQLRAKVHSITRPSLSIYGDIAPGMTFFRHQTHGGLKKRASRAYDINDACGRSKAAELESTADDFLYQPAAPHLTGLQGGINYPNFRKHYEDAGIEEAERHRRKGEFSKESCEEIARLAHLRAGLQTLHHRLWRNSAYKGLEILDGGFASTEARSFWESYSPFPNL